MKKTKKRIVLLCPMTLTVGFMVSCSKMDVGYLRTTGAPSTPDPLNTFYSVDATGERGINKLPLVSIRIQGVAGTNPINYELFGVKTDNQEQVQLLMKLYKEGKISVIGGLIVVTQEATQQLANGRCRLSFKVYNRDHKVVLEDIFKVVVTGDELPAE